MRREVAGGIRRILSTGTVPSFHWRDGVKPLETFSRGRDLNPGPREHESGVVTETTTFLHLTVIIYFH